MILDDTAPLVRDWCTPCKAYTEHDNGRVGIRAFGERCTLLAMRCRVCLWVTRYR